MIQASFQIDISRSRNISTLFWKPTLVYDESAKYTKSKILEAAEEYGLLPYLEKCPAISDGGLLSVADKQKDVPTDIEMKVKVRCACHTYNRITEMLLTVGLKYIDKKLSSSNFEGNLKINFMIQRLWLMDHIIWSIQMRVTK